MTEEQNQSKAELEKERCQVLKEIERMRIYLEDLRVTDDSVDPDASERMMSFSIMANLERKLQSIDYALSVIDRGKYGLCEECGQPINPERLKILPDTTLCARCKGEMEIQARKSLAI